MGAFKGSKDSLKYVLIDSVGYFTPNLHLLGEASNLEQLQLQGLESIRSPLPSFSSLTGLRLLSLSEGNFPSLAANNFAGLENPNSLFVDSSQIQEIESNTFANLSSLTHISITLNKIEKVEPDNFINEIQDDFSGISANTQLLLQNNQIRQLNET